MLDIIKENKVVLIVIALIIVAFAWFGLSDRTPTSSSLLTSQSRSDNIVIDQEILSVLLDMRSIRLDSSIFENAAFASLRDFGRDIIPEPVGRTNPFAPPTTSQQLPKSSESDAAVFTQ